MPREPRQRPRALRYAPKSVRTVAHRTGTAARTIGPLEPGTHVVGLTAGQFSSVDALEHMVNEIGPATARVSTWTTGIYDVSRAADLSANERLQDIRFLLDRGTFEKSPKFAGPLIQACGVQAFRCLSVHAKVTIIEGPDRIAVMRSSMNLNKNLRTEQFDISCEARGLASIGEFFIDWFDALWDAAGQSQDNAAIIEAVFRRFEASVPEQGSAAGDEAGDLDGLRLVEDDL